MAQNNQAPVEPQVENTPSGIESFVKKYQTILGWAVVAILVIIFGSLALQKWVINPAREEARAQAFVAEQQFRDGNYEAALNGDGNNLGFDQVISQYGKKAGKAVYLYAGICQLNLGNNEAAIELLKKYNGKDPILKAKAICCTGDAYANLGNNAEALSCFKKAAAVEDNTYAATYLFKAGIICEEMGKDAEALKLYKEIEVKYPDSMEAYEIAKYISRIENK